MIGTSLGNYELCKADPVVCSDVATIVDTVKEVGLGDAFRGKKFLVSGGAGFLGSWLVDALYILGGEITIVDNLSTGDIENIKHLLGSPRIRFINKHVEQLEPVRGYDYVLHLAARPSPEDYVRYPVETLRVSSLGTEKMLEVARLNDAVFLLASTSEVYGHAEVIPTPEDYWGYVNPVGPRSCYDEGKRYAEALSMAYMRQYGLDVRISRIFNTYGPRLDWKSPGYGRVITKFIVQALLGDPLTIYGNGTQTRSFLYVADNIEAHLLFLRQDKRLRGAVINIGNEEEITIAELAKLVLELTNSTSYIKYLPPRLDDPPRRRPDITRAKELLGWKPKTGLAEGLRKTIKWYSTRVNESRNKE